MARLSKTLEPLRRVCDHIPRLAAGRSTCWPRIFLRPTSSSSRSSRRRCSWRTSNCSTSAGNGYNPARSTPFFSTVDGRKKMHRELIAQARGEYEHVLDAAIPISRTSSRWASPRACRHLCGLVTAAAYDQFWQELHTAITP